MKCTNCKSERIMHVNGKTSDMCNLSYGSLEYDGYVPSGINIGEFYGDYIEFDLCVECGRVQGKFPVSDATIEKALAKKRGV